MLCGVSVRVCPGVRTEGCPREFAHPCGGVECRGHGQDPAFAHDTLFLHPDLQKWQLSFFGLFVSCCPEIAPTAHAPLFLVSQSFFVFYCQHCSKGFQLAAYVSVPLQRSGVILRGHTQRSTMQQIIAIKTEISKKEKKKRNLFVGEPQSILMSVKVMTHLFPLLFFLILLRKFSQDKPSYFLLSPNSRTLFSPHPPIFIYVAQSNLFPSEQDGLLFSDQWVGWARGSKGPDK